MVPYQAWEAAYILVDVLNVPVPQIALTQPRVCPLICKSEAARMAQHVWVHFDR